jgi:hypothetical protein
MTHSQTDVTAGEERALAAFMRRLHQTPLDVEPGIASADVLMLKLQLIRRWDNQRKARLPLDVMEPVEIGATVLAAMLLLFWSVPSAFDWLPRLVL